MVFIGKYPVNHIVGEAVADIIMPELHIARIQSTQAASQGADPKDSRIHRIGHQRIDIVVLYISMLLRDSAEQCKPETVFPRNCLHQPFVRTDPPKPAGCTGKRFHVVFAVQHPGKVETFHFLLCGIIFY